MFYENEIYEKYLMEEYTFDGTWIEYVSAYSSIKAIEYFKNSWIPSNDEVQIQNSWLELSIQLRLEKTPLKKRTPLYIFQEAEKITSELLSYQHEDTFTCSPNPAPVIEHKKEYWYWPSNPSLQSRAGPVIVHAVRGSHVEFYDSKPIVTRVNRLGRTVVDFDPSTIRSFCDVTELYSIVNDPRIQIAKALRTKRNNDTPSLCQLMACFAEPSDGTIDSPELSREDLGLLNGHRQGWVKAGACDREIAYMTGWITKNLLAGMPPYHGASDYNPTRLFCNAV
ncbi:hypothetical protein ACLHZ0_21430 [Aeromonas salmonicida]|uniref:hypothetical protein n=1 Tax=Aeromonas salmonicida TaxID=645 RepID=UPI003D081D26